MSWWWVNKWANQEQLFNQNDKYAINLRVNVLVFCVNTVHNQCKLFPVVNTLYALYHVQAYRPFERR